MSTLLWLLPFVVVGCHFVDKWYLSAGRLYPVYVMTILGSLATILFNVLLYVEADCTKSILLFCLNSTWTITMSLKGIRRLVKVSNRRTQRRDGLVWR